MKNNLSAVNSYLFESLDSLSNPDLSEEDLNKEINRSKQISQVSKTIIENGRLMLDATKYAHENMRSPDESLPELLNYEKKD